MPYADEQQTGDKKDEKKDDKKDETAKPATRFDIKIPTNAELAGNLKGKLLLVHGDMDDNVHHGGTIRLANALIKANKRFDMLILPGRPHVFGPYQPYFTQRMWEYFAEHLLDDRPSGADLYERREK
jgi:dipeptidyl aminopeptidase/acylaminoacyl peptidase